MNKKIFNQTKADAFENRLLSILNHAALSLMISVGHRTGLFDAMHPLDFAKSKKIAQILGLQERYVREWLNALVTGNIIEYKANLSKWNESEAYDLITSFDVIHDQANPELVLKNVFNALKSGGIFLMQDIKTSSDVAQNIDHPLGPLIYTIYCIHCMTVSLSQQGAGLGAAWGEELAAKMLYDAGFNKVDKKYLEHDIMNTYYLMRK